MNNEMVKAIKEEFGDDYRVEEMTVVKNNDVVVNGVGIGKKGDKVLVTVYLDNVDTVEEAVEKARRAVEATENGVANINKLNPSEFFSKDNVCKNVYPALVNRERNKMKTDVVKSEFYDLDVIYKMDLEIDEKGLGSVTISKDLLEFSNMTEEELHKMAIHNIQGKGIVGDIMHVMMAKKIGEDLEDIPSGQMNVVTNKMIRYGAGVLLDEDVIRKLRDIYDDDFYILPSSIDEVITVPYSQNVNPSDMLEMVRTINSTELEDTQFLSNNVYRFHNGEVEVIS